MAFDLKKESDVKEYVEKLGIEYRFGCYSEKKPDGEFHVKFLMSYTIFIVKICKINFYSQYVTY